MKNLPNENHAGTMLLKNGNTVNYGVKRYEGNNLVYYTGKGLREMISPKIKKSKEAIEKAVKLKNMKEEVLIKSQHIAIISLDNIEKFID